MLNKSCTIQLRIQDFLIGGSTLQRGVDLLMLHDYLLIFPDFLKNLHEIEIIMSQRWACSNPQPPSGSTTAITFYTGVLI